MYNDNDNILPPDDGWQAAQPGSTSTERGVLDAAALKEMVRAILAEIIRDNGGTVPGTDVRSNPR
jgi:hypothetical protein